MNGNIDRAGKYANELISNAMDAVEKYKTFDQKQTDLIVAGVFKAAFNARIQLADAAVEETGIGNLKHKIIKNSWASLKVFTDIQFRKTVGVISEDKLRGIYEIALPLGPILALTPIANPTSTTIFKILIALKTRNPIIFSPHRAARKSTRLTIDILKKAALNAGAPEHCIQTIRKTGNQFVEAVMNHKRLALILATGTPEVVQWAQKSGKPTLGSGAGNVPVFVDQSADFELAANYIVRSKTFDNGCVCSSEQGLVVTREVDKEFKPFLVQAGTYFCNQSQKDKIVQVSYDLTSCRMKPAVVGQTAVQIAKMAGFDVPSETTMLMVECDSIGPEYPCSQEILAPILSYFVVENVDEALITVNAIEKQGGMGHTLSLFCNDQAVIDKFAAKTSVGRILVNSPSTQGAIGGLYNHINPSFTLSTGAESGHITIDNITVDHLIHRQRLARRRIDTAWYNIPRDKWFDKDVNADEILKLYGWNS